MAPKFSRRGLIGIGAGLVAAAGASVVAFKGSPGVLGADIVRDKLPGVRLDEAGLKKFMDDEMHVYAGQWASKAKLRAFAAARPVLHAAPVLRFPPLTRKIEDLERHTLSRFLVGSDFFHVDPLRDVVTYTGERPAACPNPFAQVA